MATLGMFAWYMDNDTVGEEVVRLALDGTES